MTDTKNFWYCSVIVNRNDGPHSYLVRAASKPNPAQLHEAFPCLVDGPDSVAAIEMLTDEAAMSHPDLDGADSRPVFDAGHNGSFGLYSVLAHMDRNGTRFPYPGLVVAGSAREAVSKACAHLKTAAGELSGILETPVSFSVTPEYAHRASDSYSNPMGNAAMTFKFLVG